MAFQTVPAQINRSLESKLQSTLAEIRSGKDPEPILRGFIAEIHEEWVKKANEYAERIEAMRARDKLEFQEKLGILKNAFEAERLQNSLIWRKMNLHLIEIAQMQRDHEKFNNLKGETLQEALGSMCSAVSKLLISHENVELFDEPDEQTEDLLVKIREKSIEMANEHNSKMQSILDRKIRCNLPIPSICSASREIESEIQKIILVLHSLQSALGSMSPEYWEHEDVEKIRNWRSELEERTGNLLEMLETAEMGHMQKLREKLEFRADPTLQLTNCQN